MPDSVPVSVAVRSYRPADWDAVQQLYRDGLLGGALAENDTGVDIDDVDLAYMSDPGSHFWVAELEGDGPVGCVGVQAAEQGVGEIRRLRVQHDLRRRGIGTKLVETALEFCRRHHYLKVTLDTYLEREPALRLFEKFNFHHNRTRAVGEKQLMMFYLDLYGGEKKR